MRVTAKVLLILSSILVFGFALGSRQAANYKIEPQVLDGGGAMWLSTTHYKLSSSLGQSITGVQGGTTKKVYTGFWNPKVVELSPVEEEGDDFSRFPKDFELKQNYPNPFNPTTVIEYALPQASEVKIRIYNILGQRVRNLVEEYQAAGYKQVPWDGKDDNGKDVGSGIYFYRLEAKNFVKCRKMMLLK
jgi:hypothetical protein